MSHLRLITTLLFALALTLVPAAAPAAPGPDEEDTHSGVGPVPEESEAAEHAPLDVTAPAVPAGGSSGTVVISGAGWGHGIGMSQWGAYGRALDGQTTNQILAAYYSGLDSPAPDPSAAPLWVNLEEELTKVVLTVKQTSPSGAKVTVTRDDTALGGGVEQVELANEEWVEIRYVDRNGPVANPRRCAFRTDSFDSVVGSCMIDLVWDGDQPSPTAGVVIGNRWWEDPATGGGLPCTISGTPGCAYMKGKLHIRPDDNDEAPPLDLGFHVVQEIDIDDYAEGIREVPFSWPATALQVQAVAARSYARYVEEHRAAPSARPWCWCDLYDTSIDQVYRGQQVVSGSVVARDARWLAAVTATAGQILHYNGKAAATYYSSSNGGASENNEDVWGGGAVSYLRSVPDPWSLVPANPNASWQTAVSVDAFAAAVGLDAVWDVDIVATYASGSPSDIRVIGVKGGAETEKHFTGRQFDAMFGLKSMHITAIDGVWSAVDVDRWAGVDRYETAVAISQANFGPGTETVFIATGTDFPDALVAAPFAYAENAPLLLVRADAITAATRAELIRLDPDRIVILGGTGVVSKAVASALGNYGTVERYAGADRYTTAVEISKAAFPSGAPVVYIATGLDFADALAGAPAAAREGGPVLLTRPATLGSAIRNELARLDPDRIVILGGTAAVSAQVEVALAAYGSVERIAGANRYATAIAVAKDAYPGGAAIAFLATVDTFPDALATGPVAAALAGPLLLTDPTNLPAAVADEMRRLDPDRVVLMGGPGAIATGIEDQVKIALS